MRQEGASSTHMLSDYATGNCYRYLKSKKPRQKQICLVAPLTVLCYPSPPVGDTYFHTLGGGLHWALGCCMHSAWFTSANQSRCPVTLCFIHRETWTWECQGFVKQTIDFGSWVLDCFSADKPALPPTGSFHENLLEILVLQMKSTRAGAHLLHSALQLLQAWTGSPSPYSLPKSQVLRPFTELQAISPGFHITHQLQEYLAMSPYPELCHPSIHLVLWIFLLYPAPWKVPASSWTGTVLVSLQKAPQRTLKLRSVSWTLCDDHFCPPHDFFTNITL